MFAWFRNRQLRRQRYAAAAKCEIKFLPHLHMGARAVRVPDREDQYPAYVPIVRSHRPLDERGRPDPELGMACRLEFVPGWGVVYTIPPQARAQAASQRGGFDWSPGWRRDGGGDLVLTELVLIPGLVAGRGPAPIP